MGYKCREVSTVWVKQDLVICSCQVQFGEVAGSTEGVQQFFRMRQGKVVDDYGLVGFSEVDAKTDTAAFLADDDYWGNPFGCTDYFNDVGSFETLQLVGDLLSQSKR